jgi:hypothetical protein
LFCGFADEGKFALLDAEACWYLHVDWAVQRRLGKGLHEVNMAGLEVVQGTESQN